MVSASACLKCCPFDYVNGGSSLNMNTSASAQDGTSINSTTRWDGFPLIDLLRANGEVVHVIQIKRHALGQMESMGSLRPKLEV